MWRRPSIILPLAPGTKQEQFVLLSEKEKKRRMVKRKISDLLLFSFSFFFFFLLFLPHWLVCIVFQLSSLCPTSLPTDHFTALKLQNLSNDVSGLQKISWYWVYKIVKGPVVLRPSLFLPFPEKDLWKVFDPEQMASLQPFWEWVVQNWRDFVNPRVLTYILYNLIQNLVLYLHTVASTL